MSRFVAFTDVELTVLWDGLTTVDGLSYGFEDNDHDTDAELAREMYAEASRRGLPEQRPERWKHVVN